MKMLLDYNKHPSFSFHDKSYSVDSDKIKNFNVHYKSIHKRLSFRRSKLELTALAYDIFHDLKSQTKYDHEKHFFNELEKKSITLINEELGCFYRLSKRHGYQKKSLISDNRFALLNDEKYFMGRLDSRPLEEIIELSKKETGTFYRNSEKGLLTREDLSENSSIITNDIAKILNECFEAQGVLDVISSYMNCPYRVGGLALELSVSHATWWQDTLKNNMIPKTMYAHFDESIVYPKAIVYLSEVGPKNGPTSYYPEMFKFLNLNALQEIIGRVVGTIGGADDSKLKNYYSKFYHQPMSCERFRRHFMRLPADLRFNSHFGWDVIQGSDMEKKLINSEKIMTGSPGDFIIFDGAKLLHRGGLVEQGERIAMQIIFSPIPNLPSRITSKIKRVLK